MQPDTNVSTKYFFLVAKKHWSKFSHNKTFQQYDVAVIQWITSCHKNRSTTRVVTLWPVHVMSLTTTVSIMHCLSC